jgi:DNA-directed RNA polymerase subunit M/transcription elongation factor TFIIS
MGMDIIGTNPTDPKGEYFRNNVWYWRPLWNYVEEHFPDLADKVPGAHYNDGDGLDEEDSLLLAGLLQAHIDQGKVLQYEKDWKATIESAPLEQCNYCSQTGVRIWEAGTGPNDTQESKMLECNVCQGTGSHRSFLSAYGFSEKNVKEFAQFLEHCGGFAIH